MESDITKRVKRIQIILLLIVILLVFFGGCGDENDCGGLFIWEEMTSESESNGVTSDKVIDVDTPTASEEDGSAGSQITDQPGEVSSRRAEVVCQGDFFYKTLAEVGANGIYIVYTKELDTKERYLGWIPAEEAEIRDFDIQLTDKIALASCVDDRGSWHIMVVESGNQDWAQIWVIGADGNLERTVDISEVRKNYMRPFYMAVDQNGRYYMDSWGKLLILDENGNLECEMEVHDVAGLGVGRSGQVYGVFFEEDATGTYLAKILPEDGSLERCSGGEFSALGAKFSSLRPGVNCELLLGNKAEGVWEYRDGKLVKVLETMELPCSGQDIIDMGFLNDGRLCVMEYQEREKRNVFYFVPAERQPQN